MKLSDLEKYEQQLFDTIDRLLKRTGISYDDAVVLVIPSPSGNPDEMRVYAVRKEEILDAKPTYVTVIALLEDGSIAQTSMRPIPEKMN